ncbi:autotransporter domain-containing protein [Desulfoluna sp.]|uniref:autotransporter outer membrane beta-barrel domain-containing protein n=1 Tax=Desulfoluna sp. TaxID=2045199 RepID=UPI0026221127|nr:autotransporter outer membrane beta-barrel domain-containing protein [Desulfoluna sp.]
MPHVSRIIDTGSATRLLTLILLLLFFFFVSSLSFAGSNPVITAGLWIDEIGSGDPAKDSLIFEYIPGFNGTQGVDNAGQANNIDYRKTDRNQTIFRDITFRPQAGHTLLPSGKGYFSLLTAQDRFSETDNSAIRFITTEKLTLKDTIFDSGSQWRFLGTTNEIHLINSEFGFSVNGEVVFRDAPLAINAVSGDNAFFNWNLSYAVTVPTTLTISPGATFEIRDSGTEDPLRFDAPMAVTANNASMTIRDSVVDAFKDQNTRWTFSNGSNLSVQGSNTRLSVYSLSLDQSDIQLGNRAFLVTETLALKDSAVSLAPQSRITMNSLVVSGNSTLSGSDTRDNNVRVTTIIGTNPGSTLTLDRLERVDVISGVFLDENLSITIDNDSRLRIDNPIIFAGGIIHAQNRGVFDLYDGQPVIVQAGNTIKASQYGIIRVGPDGLLPITPALNVDISDNGTLDVEGQLVGNGTVTVASGSSALNVYNPGSDAAKDGVLSPGSNYYTGSAIGTISTDARVGFYNSVSEQGMNAYSPQSQKALLDSGLFDGGIYRTDLHVDANGVTTNDLLEYGDGGIYLAQLGKLDVHVSGSPSADELNGKEFTVIAARPGKTGTTDIELKGQSIPIGEGGSVPALIDFGVLDKSTNGHPDVTLIADKDYDHLAKHPSLTSKNHKASANLLLNAVSKGNETVINQLDTLTNAQVSQHIDSIHPEPYSSYITIALEKADMVMNTVLDQTAQRRGVSPVKDKGLDLPTLHRRFWADKIYTEGDVEGSGELGDFDYTLVGLTMGQDIVASETRSLGAYLSFGSQKMDEHDKAIQDFDGKTYHLGLYLNAWDVHRLNLHGVMGYAFGEHNSDRLAQLSELTTTATADYSSHSFYLGGKGTIQAYQNDWVTLSPELGVKYIFYSQESLTESGNPDISLKVDSADAHSIISSGGMMARFACFSERVPVYPLVFVRYEHDFYANKNNEHEIDAALVSLPDFKQTFVGQNRGENAFISGVGLGTDISSSFQVHCDFVHTEHSHGQEWSASLDLLYVW